MSRCRVSTGGSEGVGNSEHGERKIDDEKRDGVSGNTSFVVYTVAHDKCLCEMDCIRQVMQTDYAVNAYG